mgnify:CR=1 FL=1
MERDSERRLDQIQSGNTRMQHALRLAADIAGTQAHLLLQGEHGTGRRTLARAIHDASPRRRGPFLEAFARGSTRPTAEWLRERLLLADGGTLYVWDVEELPLDCLVLIENRSEIAAGTRVIAGTSHEGPTFACDPLCEVVIQLPPLRRRPEDVVPLFLELASEASIAMGRFPVEGCLDAAAGLLAEHAWTDNLFELRHVAWQAACTASGGFVTVRDLAIPCAEEAADSPMPRPSDRESKVLRRHALHVLRREGGDVDRAATALGVSRSGFYKKIKRYRIRREDFRV